MLDFLAGAALPLVACAVVGAGVLAKVELFSCFTRGAREGMTTVVQLVPTMVALMVGVELLGASGLLEWVAEAAAPVARVFGLPEALTPLVLMRPRSGSGSMSVLQQLIATEGVDSRAATAGAVILTSTETTFYTTGLYFGAVGVKDSGPTLPAALLGDLTAVVCGSLLVRGLLFG